MYRNIELQLRARVLEAAKKYLADFPAVICDKVNNLADIITLDIPKERDFGHLSTSLAMRLSGVLRKSPKDIALGISENLKRDSSGDSASPIKDTDVKGAGFINIFLKDEVFFQLLSLAVLEPEKLGSSNFGASERVLLEFVSANPTGPLSVAHARQAAVGDALANLLSHVGYDVTKEYYLNDEGNQINILGRSIHLRYRQLSGEEVDFPEDHYRGDYITDFAKELFENPATRKKIGSLDSTEKDKFFLEYGVDEILKIIKEELSDFGVFFDVWYSQKSLGKSGRIERALKHLRDKGYIYEAEGAVWFKSTEFGDDKDRVVRKSDGSYTYLAPDIAYHEDKFERGFQKLINIWGPDHHGYIPRMRSAVQAMGKDRDALSVIIVQLATLFRAGQPVPMSTRKGQYVTLREVLNEVGRDASRFFFLMRKTDSHLDFDLELAKKHTPENPVYYIQYAHARIAGILAAAPQAETSVKEADFSLLKEKEEKDLMRAIFEFGYCLEVCAKQLDPYALTTYLQGLAASFHRFYDKHKVLSSDQNLTNARLFLIRVVKLTLARGLTILGVSSPERM